jgi:hypothetical protein
MSKYVIKETKETCVVLETFTDLFGNEKIVPFIDEILRTNFLTFCNGINNCKKIIRIIGI